MGEEGELRIEPEEIVGNEEGNEFEVNQYIFYEEWPEDVVENFSSRDLNRYIQCIKDQIRLSDCPASFLGVYPVNVLNNGWMVRWNYVYEMIKRRVNAIQKNIVVMIGEPEDIYDPLYIENYNASMEFNMVFSRVKLFIDVIEHEIEVMTGMSNIRWCKQHHIMMENLCWVDYVKNDKGEVIIESSKPKWQLLLQQRAYLTAMKQSACVVNNSIYTKVPGSPRAVQPLKNVDALREKGNMPMDMKKWIWKYVVGGLYPEAELARQIRLTPGLVDTTSNVLLSLDSPMMPHVRLSDLHISFNDGIVLCIGDIENDSIRNNVNQMHLKLADECEMEREGILCSTHHPYDFNVKLLDLPLPPPLSVFVDGEWENREGDALLEWLKGDSEFIPSFSLEELSNSDPDTLTPFVSVLMYVLTCQSICAQTIWIILFALGRCFYRYGRFDNIQRWMHIQGPTRCAKGVLLHFLTKALGEDSIGIIKTTSNDTFSFADSLIWRLFIIQELRGKKASIGIDQGEFLQFVAGESHLVRGMREHGYTSPRTAFSIITTGNGGPPFTNIDGEFDSRLLHVVFDKSFLGKEDTTLTRQLDAQIAANIILCVRIYQITVRALGNQSITPYIPKNMIRMKEMSEVRDDSLYTFLHNPEWCSIQTNGEPLARILEMDPEVLKDMPKPHICRIDELGEALQLSLIRQNRTYKYPWIPRKYVKVFRLLNFLWRIPGDDGKYESSELISFEGMVFGVELTPYAYQELEKYRNRFKRPRENENP
jgi:hypothetical protein